jgi:hypothetical protein
MIRSRLVGRGRGMVSWGSIVMGFSAVWYISDVSRVVVGNVVSHGLEPTVGKLNMVFAIGGIAVTALAGSEVDGGVVVEDLVAIGVVCGLLFVGGSGMVGGSGGMVCGSGSMVGRSGGTVGGSGGTVCGSSMNNGSMDNGSGGMVGGSGGMVGRSGGMVGRSSRGMVGGSRGTVCGSSMDNGSMDNGSVDDGSMDNGSSVDRSPVDGSPVDGRSTEEGCTVWDGMGSRVVSQDTSGHTQDGDKCLLRKNKNKLIWENFSSAV